MLRHEEALQRIADRNGGTRVAGTAGFEDSVSYVVKKLKKAGYEPRIQRFPFPFFQELSSPVFERMSPTAHTYVETTDFGTMQYSGSGDVTENVQEVTNNQFPPGVDPGSSTAGCAAADFTGFTPGNVALIQRGTCTFGEKAMNAQLAGASAVIIFNEGQEGRTDAIIGTLGDTGFTIPVIGTTFAIGEEIHNLLQSGPVTVHIKTETVSETREAANVIAHTSGNGNRVVVQGSHLDSVAEGPGINDNGSGSAYNLEAAIQIAKKNIEPRNRIRFAWWGAEEEGLWGSQTYVDSLSDEKFAKILLNLNFDMLASPNFVRFVYDGDGSDTGTAGPPGSAEIEHVFVDYFDSQGLATDPTAFDGRSDYGPFIDRGAPAGGLFSGAEGVKTDEQAAVYGGTAGEPYDRCYHQACDDITNLNLTSLDQLSDGAATALATFAFWRGPVVAPAPRVVTRGVSTHPASATRRGSQLIR
jgi:Zn-dependent M28 family amino/carboxypeptidase